MTLTHSVVTWTIKGLTNLLARVDGAQLAGVPHQGPLILVLNHVNFLEIPVLYTRLVPRTMAALVKVETWDNPVFGPLANLWGGIPLDRDEVSTAAIRQALAVLDAGAILVVTPEGTRSGHGHLQRGNPGIVLLALRSGAPLLPLVFWGGELIWQELARLRRTSFEIAVGQPFTLDTGGAKVTSQMRQQMTDEILYQMAALLPPSYRGVYSDLSVATETYLHFLPGAETNLGYA